MKKRLLLILLLFSALAAFFVTGASAESSGPYEYTVSDGKATITKYTGKGGSLTIPSTLGDCPVTAIGDKAFYECTKVSGVIIPDSVTDIGKQAFYGVTYLSEAVIGDGVENIGESAFAGCAYLMYVTFGSGLKNIGAGAFNGCKRLVRADLPDSVESMGNNAFRGCTALADKNGLVIVKDVVFDYFGNGGDVIIPDGVTVIGFFAFNYSPITSVSIPGGVTSIGYEAFYGCPSLTDVYFRNSQTSWNKISIAVSLEGGNTSLETVTIHFIPESVTVNTASVKTVYAAGEEPDFTGLTLTATYSDESSETITSGFTCSEVSTATAGTKTVTVTYEGRETTFNITVTPPAPSVVASGTCGKNAAWSLYDDGVLTLSGTGDMYDYDFSYNETPWHSRSDEIKTVVIQNGVTGIGDGAFCNCYSLSSVTVPDTLTSIGRYAFSRCTSLTGITIPSGVTSIGNYAFYDCSSLTDVYYGGTETQWAKITIGTDNAPLESASIHYNSSGAASEYKWDYAVADDTITLKALPDGGTVFAVFTDANGKVTGIKKMTANKAAEIAENTVYIKVIAINDASLPFVSALSLTR